MAGMSTLAFIEPVTADRKSRQILKCTAESGGDAAPDDGLF